MQEFIIYLSLVPILAVFLNSLLKGPRYLSYSIPTIIYLIIFALIVAHTPKNPILGFELAERGVMLKDYSLLFFSINEVALVPNNSYQVYLDFIFDRDYSLMALIVLGISTSILLYSSKFIESETTTRYNRYFLFLTIFISSMFLFSLSNDLFGSFIFWELLGLSSYFLIGYWNKDDEAIKSSTMAFWITRVGDLFFLAGLIMIFCDHGHLSIDKLGESIETITTLPMACIAIGILSKSAQFPFNIWLPKAMKGPTPVSSLIHSATMVVAGVFLLYKTHPLYSHHVFTLNLLFYIGIISTLIGSIIAFTEKDLKKILAYSTISHIGLMFVAMGLPRAADIGYFHLFSHSLFKSMLFLYAGIIIILKGSSNIEDLKGSVKSFSPLGIILLIGCLSLSSVYAFTGSFSKEFILYEVLHQERYIELLGLLVSVFFTALYSSRIYFYITDLKFKNSNKLSIKNLDWVYYFPLIALATFSAMGFWTMDIFNNNTYRPGEFIHPSEIGNEPSYSGLISINVYVFFLQVLILSTFAINFFYASRITSYLKTVSHAAIGAFNSDKFYIEIYENVFKSLSKFIAWFDRNIVDGLINYIPLKLWGISRHLMGLQDGTARKYGIRMILFFVLLALVMGIINNIVSMGVHP